MCNSLIPHVTAFGDDYCGYFCDVCTVEYFLSTVVIVFKSDDDEVHLMINVLLDLETESNRE